MDKLYKVTLREDGKWEVFKKGNVQATRVFDEKQDAVDFAKELSEKQDVSMKVEPATPVEQSREMEKSFSSPVKKEIPVIQKKENAPIDPLKKEEPAVELQRVGFFRKLLDKLSGK